MSEQQSILLFGRAGCGKSSIANMLVQGDIYQNENMFEVSDGAVGETVNIYGSCTEKYQVFDTVGLGGLETHPVPHKNAINEIRNYFAWSKESLNYLFYVKKKERICNEDKKTFKLFREIFKWAEKNFVIIITNSNPEWVEKNLGAITDSFGKYPIISVDFPLTDEGEDDDTACNDKIKRVRSLQRLENNLAELNYQSIKLEVLSSSQKTEKDVSKIVGIVPVIGSTYQLIASGVYRKLEKPNYAKERLIDGTVGITVDTMSMGVAGVSKNVFVALIKDVTERILYGAGKEAIERFKGKFQF
ncbi:hypothetical protein C1646_694557 [Rhizophagus diaphanus]|nr:hypothetical protein C1646_694557 [Rhizophagus diaphanus] [Rhizophagus sp. MUCL 43196]